MMNAGWRGKAAPMIVVLALGWAALAPAEAQTDKAGVTWLIHARVLQHGAEQTDVSLELKGAKIVAVRQGYVPKVTAGVQVVDLAGKTVLPGLIDAHAHLGLLEGAHASDTAYTRQNIASELVTFSRYGVTAIQSLGVNRDLVYELREEQKKGLLAGATIFTAGRGIGAPGGAPPMLLAPDQVYRPVNGEDARADVQEMASHKVDMIKIWEDSLGGEKPKVTPEVYQAVIQEAHKHHLRVAAHVHDLADARAMVDAGLDVLAHSVRDQVMDDAFVAELKAKGVFYMPTLTVDDSGFDEKLIEEEKGDPFFQSAVSPEVYSYLTGPEYAKKAASGDAHRKDLEIAKQNLLKAYRAGVKVGFGTDAGAFAERIPGFAEHRELELMVSAGLTPAEALQCATATNADLLKQSELGAIVPGAIADLLVVDADPLADIRNTRRISQVYHNGKRVSDTPPEPTR